MAEKVANDHTHSFGMHLDITVKAIKQDIIRTFKQEGIDITPEQWTILNMVEEDQVTQRDLADASFKDAPTVSRIIDLLEAKGYLNRKADKSDRRRFVIGITNSGKKILEKSSPIIYNARKRGWRGLSNDDFEDLKRILDRIYSNIQEDQ